jgi:hypothetical protein
MPEEADGYAVDTAAVADFINSGGEGYDDAPDPQVDPAQDAATQVEQTPEPLLGPDPDVSDLPPDVQALVNQRVLELRQGLTRRTTELADANRLIEAAGDPDSLLEAWTFQQQLMADGPEGDEIRARLYQALTSQYGAQTPAVPSATPEVTPSVDPFAEYDLPPEISNVLAMVPQLQQQLQQLTAANEAAAQEQAQAQYVQDVANDLTSRLSEITTEFSDLAGAEDDILNLAYSTDGNLLAAVDLYRELESRIASRLFEGAVNVPGGSVTPPVGGGHSTEPPAEITNFKDLRGPVTEWLEQHSS